MDIPVEQVRTLQSKIGCGLSLTRDLLLLAGGDQKLVVEASEQALGGVETLKAYILNKRISNLESHMPF